MSKTSNLNKAVSHIKRSGEIRQDQLNRLGVTDGDLRAALKKDGLGFTTKDYSGGIFGDDNPFEDHPAETYLDLVSDDDDDGPGGIDY